MNESDSDKNTLLYDKLIERGMISKDQLEIAIKNSKKSNRTINESLIDLGFLTETTLSSLLSENTGVKDFSLQGASLDVILVKKIPKDIAMRYKMIPVLQSYNALYVAISDVHDVIALDNISKYFEQEDIKITPVYASESDIMDAIDKHYGYAMSIDEIFKEIESGDSSNDHFNTQDGNYKNPVVRLVDSILIDAIKNRVSDIHFEPESNFVRVRYRMDGNLIQIKSFHIDYWSSILVRIKIMSEMNIAESRKSQDGRISYNMAGNSVDFRVATHLTTGGENIVLRILDKKKSLVPLSTLGFSESNEKLLLKLLKRPEGIIIVTGPTGSGKTTTLYSILSKINKPDVNIMTVEDPVEYQLSMIRQSNVQESSGMTFASAVKSLMRQDPDIIFVGEVRDEDTAIAASRAAMTGHQVFTTLHTNNAVASISRLLDIGLERGIISDALVGIVAQRLVRKVCVHCRGQYVASQEECRIMNVDAKQSPNLYKSVGCEECRNTGYKGSIAISEILHVDINIAEMIATGKTAKEITEYAMTKDFVPMINDAVLKVWNGITTLDEVINHIDFTSRL